MQFIVFFISSLYNGRSDEESEDSDGTQHRSFLDILAYILSDFREEVERGGRSTPTRKINAIVSSLKKGCLEPDDPGNPL